MNRLEHAKALRADQQRHYNCCQAAFIPFCQECGLDPETAMKIGAHFGSGMRHGATCGAVTGALMALGLSGTGEEKALQLLQKFKAKNGALTCGELLAQNAKNGGDKKTHCDGVVMDAVEIAEELLK